MNNNETRTGYVKPPDGHYVGEIYGIAREEASDGHPKYKWFVNAKNCMTGQEVKITKVYSLCSKKALDFMLKELELIGVTDVKSREDIDAKKDDIMHKRFLFEAVTREDGWQCYYIKGLATDEPPEAESSFGISDAW